MFNGTRNGPYFSPTVRCPNMPRSMASRYGLMRRSDIGRDKGCILGPVTCTSRLGAIAFWHVRLPDSRDGTGWKHTLQTLTVYRLLDPGSE